MELLKERIRKDGVVRGTDVLKVDSFLNHQMDIALFEEIGREFRRLFADCGVDAIIGHHPHVLQPVEWIEGKDGNRTLCVYSLGNFMAEQAYDYNMVGGIISFDIVQIADAEPYIDNVLFTPTVFHFPSNFYNNTIYLMEDYTPELAAVHGVRTFYKHTLTYDRLIAYATDTIDEQFLPEFLKGDSE